MKDDKTLIVLFFIMIGLNLSAQSFERYIKHNYSEQGIIDPIEFRSGDFVVGSIFPYTESANDYSESMLYQMNSNGILIDSVYLPFGIQKLFLENSSLMGIGNRFNPSDTSTQQLLFKFQPNSIDTLFTRKLNRSDSLYESSYVKYVNYCNCYTEIGFKSDTSFKPVPYVRQFDSSLTVLNYKEFTSVYGSQLSFPYLDSFLERTDEDGIVIIGSNLDSFNIIYDQYPAVLYFLDANLNRDTTKHPIQLITSIPISGGVNAHLQSLVHSTRLNDSTYLFAGSGISSGHFIFGDQDIGLIKTDTAFNYISAQFYGLRDTIDSPAPNFLSRTGSGFFLFSTTNIDIFGSDWYLNLTKLDNTGNIVWSKFFKKGTRLYARGVLATSDGGVLMIANEFDFNKPTQPVSGPGDLDIYILKVDSNGNQTSVGIAEGNAIPENNFLFYPNPIKDQLTIRKVNQFGNYQLYIFDSFGKQVLDYNWVNDQAQLDLSHLKSGMYVYLLVDDDGRSAGGKIIKK